VAKPETAFRALLFADLVDSTRVVAELGDVAAAELWTTHDRGARDLLAGLEGREIDRSDGFFIVFDSVGQASAFALAYQSLLARLGLQARIGVHCGDVLLRRNTAADIARGAKPLEVEGLAKPVAARLMALAAGGQILLSAAARERLSKAPPGSQVRLHGHYRLKGVEEPLEVSELGAADSAAFVPPSDGDKAYRVVRLGELWVPVRQTEHNLPPERDAFVGRVAELRGLHAALDGAARLLTILGAGGIGKTRLARRYGASWLGAWPGGVYFCDCSEARSLDGICFVVASVLAIPLGRDNPAGQLGHAIAGRGRCLLIFDNFEQVVGHAPASIGAWLDRAAEATFLVTSRETLRLPGEIVFPLEALPLDGDAIDLFVHRAQSRRDDFVPDATQREAIGEVVRLLDGLPLAIELAAARIGVLSLQQLVSRLRDRFRALAANPGATARHATLRAAIDWSWELLTEWEQAALAQCSVFEGGFTLEAAEAVIDLAPWPAAPEPMEAVQALIDKSLLRSWLPRMTRRFAIDEPYFGMYLSIRDYAAERLAGDPVSATAARSRHGRHYGRHGSGASLALLFGRGAVERRFALSFELDNLVVACRRAVQHGDGETAVRCLLATWEVIELQGPFSIAPALGESVLAMAGLAATERMAALVAHGSALQRAGRNDAARAALEASIALAAAHGDRCAEASARSTLGAFCRETGRLDEARACLEASLPVLQACGLRRREASTLGNLGNLHHQQGRIDEARHFYDLALRLAAEHADQRSRASALGSVAVLHHDQGRLDDAEAADLEALALHRDAGDRRFEALVLNNLAGVHYERGRLDDALARFDEALGISREIGYRRSEGSVLANIGAICQEQGRADEARLHLEAALVLLREAREFAFEGIVLQSLGLLHLDAGRTDASRANLEAALAVHRSRGDGRLEGAVLGDLARLALHLGLDGEARAALERGEALLRQVDDPIELAKLLCVRGQADLGAGNAAAARAALVEAESIARSLGIAPTAAVWRAVESLRERITA